jgi:rfaE bifunctional protein nucleotidyltransferase chain/domain/rfaE bifunctional protein kinase chain/domain
MTGDPAAGWLAGHVSEVGAALAALRAEAARVDRWAATLARVLGGGGRLLVAGNGGSAAEAQHLTSELVGRFRAERAPYSALALTAETSSLTALLNDYGAEEVFARQVRAHGRRGDVLLLLSTSGASPNVLRAAEAGRAAGLAVWGLTGPAPNPLAALADDALCVPAPTTAGVQAVHLVVVHALCAAFDARVDGGARDGVGARDKGAAVARDGAGARDRAVPAGGLTAPAGSAAAPASPTAPASAPPGDRPAPRSPGANGTPTRRPRVVVVGDLLLDRDVEGTVDRVSPDAPVPVVDVAVVRESPGGAGLAALLCAASGAEVTLVAPVADDAAGRRVAALLAPDVALVALPHVGGTRTKTRVRSAGQSLVRLDEGGPGRPGALDDAALAPARRALAAADAVLVSDYGAGTTRDPALRALLAGAAARARAVWDPHPRGGAPVPGCALVTPNLAEARAAVGDGRGSGDGRAGGDGRGTPPETLAGAVRDAWRARAAVVTDGARGAYLAAAGDAVFAPAPPVPRGDPCGAGDRFAASATVALARGEVPSRAVGRAVADASAWVAAGGAEGFRQRRDGAGRGGAGAGAAAADGAAALGGARPDGARPDGARPHGAARHVPADDPLAALATRLRARGGTLVATGGCFDLVHAGHVATLQAARRLGDALVVLLNSDDSVRRLKGPGRPVVAAVDRARVLEALGCVDAVVVFDGDDPRAALDRLRPDVWTKGGDYGGTRLPEADVVERHGGRVVLLPYLDGRSTTALLDRPGAVRADGRSTT